MTVLGALRKDYYAILTNQTGNISKIFTPSEMLQNLREYYNVYKMYTKDYILSEEIANPELKKKRLMKDKLRRGAPKEPSFISRIEDLIQIKSEELNSNEDQLITMGSRTGSTLKTKPTS